MCWPRCAESIRTAPSWRLCGVRTSRPIRSCSRSARWLSFRGRFRSCESPPRGSLEATASHLKLVVQREVPSGLFSNQDVRDAVAPASSVTDVCPIQAPQSHREGVIPSTARARESKVGTFDSVAEGTLRRLLVSEVAPEHTVSPGTPRIAESHTVVDLTDKSETLRVTTRGG